MGVLSSVDLFIASLDAPRRPAAAAAVTMDSDERELYPNSSISITRNDVTEKEQGRALFFSPD